MFDRRSTFGEALADPEARAILEDYLPGAAESPLATQFRDGHLGSLLALVPALADPAERERFWTRLAVVGPDLVRPAEAPAIAADPAYESSDVPVGSARVTLPESPTRWSPVELWFDGPAHGNPFIDVDLAAVFTRAGERIRMGGFYDGDGRYAVRFLPDAEGDWSFVTESTARSLDGITGTVHVGPPRPGAHGPVRVDGFHFRHADGTRHRPLGTTAYAWTHQDEALQGQTLATLATAPFVKLRFCIFPKSYQYNSNEPDDFPFPGSLAEGFDTTRFDPAHFRRLERRIAKIDALGIQADLILFHAYDRWGFADLGTAADDRYVRYVVRRLSGFPNIWWSMANEYDLVWSKDEADWERLAGIVTEEDPAGHLRSIHNCIPFYDHARPWITHVSAQRIDLYKTAENVDEWRRRWGKPVVVDECAYEGDIDQGWGNISGQELTRRFWEGAVRGGYVGHGETYLRDDEVLWWSKGGVLHGSSPARIAFLEKVLADAPGGVLDPVHSEFDLPVGAADGYRLAYFGFGRPRFRRLVLPEGEWRIDVLDTWQMTIDPVPGTHRGETRVELPGREFMALRMIRVGP